MSQEYDKIFKENIEDMVLPLLDRVLGLRPDALEEVPDDLQRTLERKPDFLKKARDGKQSYLLHVEFQTRDSEEMPFRMLEYYALLLRQYRLDVHQYVIFLRPERARMRTRLQQRGIAFEYKLVKLHDFPYQTFVGAQQPEEVILAILADFGQDPPRRVIEQVLSQLKNAPVETLRRQKCVKQLEILSTLRGLQDLVTQIVDTMPIEYDIEKDVRYRQGFQKRDEMARLQEEEARLREEEARLREEEARLREEEARLREEEARLREEDARQAAQALLQQRQAAIERMLRKGMTPAQIAELLDIGTDTIVEVQRHIG